MEKRELAALLCQRARLRDFRCQRGRAWKLGRELAVFLNISSSTWGKGKYIGFGPSVRAMVDTGRIPKWRGGCLLWATSLESPFKPLFERADNDHEGLMRAEELTEALDWLIFWVDTHLTNEAWVREQVLTPGTELHVRATRDMQDWAHGQLREVIYYYPEG